MLDIRDYGIDKMRMTLRMITEEALRREWQVLLYRPGSSHMRLVRPDKRSIEMYGSAPETTSYVAAHMADNKHITNIKLADEGLPIIPSEFVKKNERGQDFAQKLFDAGKECVVKPSNGSHGDGITIGIRDQEQLRTALALAREHSSTVLVQEYLENRTDIRVLCIDYKVSAALIRRPARVCGDGRSTVAELIAIENKDERRGVNYARELNIIDPVVAKRFLGKGIHDVPAKNELYQVVGTANVGTGGETIDITDCLPDWLTAMAEAAAKTLHLPVCGVDFLLQEVPSKAATAIQLKPAITEVNKAPALYIHETPTEGLPRPVIAELFDYLSSI